MKRPLHAVIEAAYDTLNQGRGFQFDILSDLITFVRWVTGFSIGGLSLIFVNISVVRENYANNEILPILILLIISVFSGMFFHIAAYFYQIRLNSAYVFLRTSFSEREEVNSDPEPIDKENDVDKVLWSLKTDFGEDFSEERKIYDTLEDEEQKKEMLSEWKMHHQVLSEWARKDYNNGVQYVGETYQRAFGKSEKHLKKLIEEVKPEQNAKWMKFWEWTSLTFFFICSLAFLFALILLSLFTFK